MNLPNLSSLFSSKWAARLGLLVLVGALGLGNLAFFAISRKLR